MRIDDDIALALSGGLGFDLSDPYDCNVFLIRGRSRWLVFDAGVGRQPGQFAAALSRDGIAAADIGPLFLTHGHADHSGGAGALRKTYGSQVYAGAITARLVSSGDEAAIGLAKARATGGYPADYRYAACPVDHALADGETVEVDGLSVTAIATPGHSADHVSYLVRSATRVILVGGDALFFGGKVAIQDIPDCNIGDICQSVRKLAAVDYEVLLPGHLNFSLANGRRHADLAMAYVARSACPPSII